MESKRARSVMTVWAPERVHFRPLPQRRSLTRVWQAASVTPLPMGNAIARNTASFMRSRLWAKEPLAAAEAMLDSLCAPAQIAKTRHSIEHSTAEAGVSFRSKNFPLSSPLVPKLHFGTHLSSPLHGVQVASAFGAEGHPAGALESPGQVRSATGVAERGWREGGEITTGRAAGEGYFVSAAGFSACVAT